MPVSHDALVAIGRAAREGYSNNVQSDSVVLAPLTDLFAMPPGSRWPTSSASVTC
jgi:hypothetical protein